MRKLMILLAMVALGAAVAGSWRDIMRYAKIEIASRRPEYVPAGGRQAYLAHEHHGGEDDFDPARRGGPAAS